MTKILISPNLRKRGIGDAVNFFFLPPPNFLSRRRPSNQHLFCDIEVGTVVNIEFDILGKYIARLKSFE